MKNLIFIFLVFCSFSFVACNDDDNSTDEKWKKQSFEIYDKVQSNAFDGENWIVIDSPPGVPEGVYYNIVRSGEGTEKPIQTSSVKVLYKGYFLNDKEELFDTGTNGIHYESIVGYQNLPDQGVSDVIYIVWEGDQYKTYIWRNELSDYEEGKYNLTTSFSVNGVVRGFGVALQNMVVGDLWEICVPYNLGYGEGGLTVSGVELIKGYSTLFFEIELLEID